VNTNNETVLDLPEVIKATWKSRDCDHSVTVLGDLGVGADGRHYVSVLDTRTGLPLDELEF
jgi:hypothetical protein